MSGDEENYGFLVFEDTFVVGAEGKQVSSSFKSPRGSVRRTNVGVDKPLDHPSFTIPSFPTSKDILPL